MENNDLYKKILGKHIRRTRKELDLTQIDVTNKTGIDDKHLGRIERGKRLAGTQTLRQLREKLNISIDKLFDDVQKEMNDRDK